MTESSVLPREPRDRECEGWQFAAVGALGSLPQRRCQFLFEVKLSDSPPTPGTVLVHFKQAELLT